MSISSTYRDSVRWRSAFAFYALVRKVKSRKLPSIPWRRTDPAAPRLVSCVYKEDVPLLRQCLKTLHQKNARPPAALLVGDSPEAVKALKLAFNDGDEAVEIVFWKDFFATLPATSKNFVAAWLEGGPFSGYARKFAVTLAVNEREALVMCDADVLFGGDFFENLRVMIRKADRIWTGEDYHASYDHKTVKLLGELRILTGKPLNCGLVYYPKGILPVILNDALLERALPLAQPADNHLEQTLIAYAFWKNEGKFFPKEMLVTTMEDNLHWKKGLNSHARHYAGGKHLFWRDV